MLTTAKLIKRTYTKDAVGNEIASETNREILVEQKSITRQEWTSAGRQNLNPAVLLSTPLINYDGEDIAELSGKRYSIYRTYDTGDNIELYLELKGGTE